MNKMADVAAMFDLELGECFKMRYKGGGQVLDWTYHFEEDGLHCDGSVLTDVVSSRDLNLLLRGEYEVVRKRWKPKFHEEYYSLYPGCGMASVQVCKFIGDDIDLLRWDFGNCFKTESEARAHGDEIMAKFDAVKEDIQNAQIS